MLTAVSPSNSSSFAATFFPYSRCASTPVQEYGSPYRWRGKSVTRIWPSDWRRAGVPRREGKEIDSSDTAVPRRRGSGGVVSWHCGRLSVEDSVKGSPVGGGKEEEGTPEWLFNRRLAWYLCIIRSYTSQCSNNTPPPQK